MSEGKNKELNTSQAMAMEAMDICKNCRTEFSGKFCPCCGQPVKDLDRPLQFLLVDYAGNIFAFDSRFWRSFVNVLFKPGTMELEYLQGKRVKYMPPFRMYIFMSFLLFFTLSIATRSSIKKNFNIQETDVFNQGMPASSISLKDSLLVGLSQNMKQPLLKSLPDSAAIKQIKGLNISTDKSQDNQKISHIVSNPEIYIARFFKYFSWALFILMPIYGFLLWAFFRKSRKYYISHYLLSVNQHVFTFLIIILVLFAQLIFPLKTISPESYLMYLVPLYAFIGAKKVYKKSWISVLFRLAAVVCLYLFLTALVTAAVVYFSFF